MSGNLEALEDWAGPLLRKLEPTERAKLARSLAQQLRRNQQQRVKAQQNPDGSQYAPRKKRDLLGKKGNIRRRLEMFQKLRTATYLKATGTPQAISVGFTGRIARIAQVHQYGLRDRAGRDASQIAYEQRQVLGFADDDLDMIRNSLIDHLHARIPTSGKG